MSEQMLKDLDAKTVFEMRKGLYELLASCIPPLTILSTFFDELLPRFTEDELHEFIRVTAHYDRELRNGGKYIFHLEAFVVEVMSLCSG